MIKKYVRFSFVLVVTIGIFIFLFSRVSFVDVISSIKKADFKIILLTLMLSTISNIFIAAYRWKMILSHLGCSISLRESLMVKMGSNFLTSILPLKTGEFSRIVYLKRVKGVSYSRSTVSIIAEYVLNILALLFCLFLGIIVYFIQSRYIILFSAINIPFLSLALVCSLRPSLYRKLKDKLNAGWYVLFKTYFKQLTGLIRNKTIILCTALFIVSELINICLLSKALRINLPLYAILIFTPLVIISGSLTVTISGLGIRELSVLFLFSQFASSELLVSLGVLYFFVEYFFPMIIGTSVTGVFLRRIFKGVVQNQTNKFSCHII